MAKRQQPKRSVLPEWLSGFSDDDGTEATMGGPAKFLRIIFCDNAGVRRCRVVPMHRLKRVEASGVGLTTACMGLGVWEDVFITETGLGYQGEVLMMLDSESRVVCPWHPTHEMALADLHTKPGQVWGYCPRSALKRVLESAKKEFGIEFVIGQEIEFYLLGGSLLDPQTKRRMPEPIDHSVYCQTGAVDSVAALMDDICEAVESFSIPIEQYHAESGPGQFEIAIAPCTGLQAADNVIYMREAIEAISQRHGLTATFLPKPREHWAGSGAHTHFSMQDSSGENLMGRLMDGLQGEGSLAESFIAGILMHLPAVLLFTLPSPVSYYRLKANTWAGAYRVWGILNKEVPLRVCPGLDASQTNVEVKSVDNTSNPYLAFAAILLAGIQGIRAKARLPAEAKGNPADDTVAEQLPESLEEAISAYHADQDFEQALESELGAPLLKAFVAVKCAEAKKAETMTVEERMDLLYQAY